MKAGFESIVFNDVRGDDAARNAQAVRHRRDQIHLLSSLKIFPNLVTQSGKRRLELKVNCFSAKKIKSGTLRLVATSVSYPNQSFNCGSGFLLQPKGFLFPSPGQDLGF